MDQLIQEMLLMARSRHMIGLSPQCYKISLILLCVTYQMAIHLLHIIMEVSSRVNTANK